MKIAIDAMGGDHAPKSAVMGAVLGVKEFDVEVCLIGNKTEIHKYMSEEDKSNDKISIIEASEIIGNDDVPVTAIKQKKDSSMVVGLKQVKDGVCDAFLSAGSTGAFLAGSLLKVGRIKGIDRPALSPLIPTMKGSCMIIDAGANLDCKPKNLQQFAMMGSIYMEKVMGIDQPRVGLLNVGVEEGKGNELTKQSFELLSRMNINFIGNIEARDIAEGVCDVCVCDGFAGNVLLKNTEGVAQVIFDMLKGILMQNTMTKIAALMLKKGLRAFKKKFDYKEVGGAPFMGIDGIMIKAHGSSDARAVKNAIRQAKLLYDNKCLEIIRQEILNMEVDTVEDAE
ncbi:MAG: fatty acid/phospholipid synthesis protein PlsX [Clostridia bacterium]|jgi:glycerol-3-phosphate acyltransferase PlsX|nr:fatty acid/phospholipid synthesis protein PlsX [Clostridia bacterium]